MDIKYRSGLATHPHNDRQELFLLNAVLSMNSFHDSRSPDAQPTGSTHLKRLRAGNEEQSTKEGERDRAVIGYGEIRLITVNDNKPRNELEPD